MNPEDLTFLTREGCAQTQIMRQNLDTALSAKQIRTNYVIVDLDSLPPSDIRRGYPTPTVLYRGADLFGLPTPTPPIPEPT